MALFNEDDVEDLLVTADLIRNRAKIEAVIHNAEVCQDWTSPGGTSCSPKPRSTSRGTTAERAGPARTAPAAVPQAVPHPALPRDSAGGSGDRTGGCSRSAGARSRGGVLPRHVTRARDDRPFPLRRGTPGGAAVRAPARRRGARRSEGHPRVPRVCLDASAPSPEGPGQP
ncbi:DNA-3-methyladenine glycosylase I [Kocuria rhizophila]|nr:DNA-3-methyladenine glycosylase I [Kocuria rhizophila]